jgi:opine dehydrogenase
VTGSETGNLPPIAVAVLGAGSAGLALSGRLAADGHSVRLWNRSPQPLDDVRRRGGVALSGAESAFGRPDVVTDNLGEAVSGCDLVVVTTVGNAHADLAASMSAWLDGVRGVALSPGRTGGALVVAEVLSAAAAGSDSAPPPVLELQSNPVLCRARGADVRVLAVKQSVAAAGLPHPDLGDAVELLAAAVPSLRRRASVLETSFANIGAMLHPALVLARLSALGTGAAAFLYRDIPPAAVELIEELDAERTTVANAYGVVTPTLRDWLSDVYGVEGGSLAGSLSRVPGYEQVPAPTSTDSRLLLEDVPMGLVPLLALGLLAGAAMPATERTIDAASQATGTDLRAAGRTLGDMGLTALSVDQITELAG